MMTGIKEMKPYNAGEIESISLVRRIKEEQIQYGASNGKPYTKESDQQTLDHLTIVLGFSKILVNNLECNPRLYSYALQVNKSARLLYELFESRGETDGGEHTGMGEGAGK